jgi:hypothetical protein
VKSRLSRALGRLRAVMDEQAGGGSPPLTRLQGGGE